MRFRGDQSQRNNPYSYSKFLVSFGENSRLIPVEEKIDFFAKVERWTLISVGHPCYSFFHEVGQVTRSDFEETTSLSITSLKG